MEQPSSPNDDEKRLHDWIASLHSGNHLDSLSDPEKAILLVYKLELEVSNGGIHQYFKNPAGDEWRETLAALRRIGAVTITQIFVEALAIFPGASPSTDHATRAQQLHDAGPEAEAVLEALTDEYYALYRKCPEEDSYAKMSRFYRNLTAEGHRPEAL